MPECKDSGTANVTPIHFGDLPHLPPLNEGGGDHSGATNMKNPEIMSNELSREQKHAIDAAVMALKKILPPEYPFDKVEQAIKRVVLKWDSNQATKKKHGNRSNFQTFYFPLVGILHIANPNRHWTFVDLAACLIAYIEKYPNCIPKSEYIAQDTIRKYKLKNHMEALSKKFGIVFTHPSSSAASAIIP